ncbi:MAG: hypothetical protein ACI4SH_01805 [Candidatus Scatosoma sp.]
MSIFKQVKFITAVCPECRGNLRLDPKMETAVCSKCGAQIIVRNAKEKNKQGVLETVLDFVERQQTIRKQEQQEQRQKEEEDRKKREEERAERKRCRKERFKQNWWKYLFIGVGVYLLCAVLSNLIK